MEGEHGYPVLSAGQRPGQRLDQQTGFGRVSHRIELPQPAMQ